MVPNITLDEADAFCDDFSIVQRAVYDNAIAHGFWEGDGCTPGEKIALMHQELSELLDNFRDNNFSELSSKIGDEGFNNMEEEAADLVIRLMDFCQHNSLRLAPAIVAKHNYNIGRPHKHGRSAY